MEHKFSVFESLLFSFKSALDNFRLFFLASLVWLGAALFGISLLLISLGASLTSIIDLANQMAQGLKGATFITAAQAILYAVGPIHLLSFLIVITISGYILVGIGLGFIALVLEFYDTGASQVSRIFSCFGLAMRAFFATALYCGIIFVGLLLLIFPGLYWAFRFLFFGYFIVDQNASVIDSLKQSWAITRGQGWRILSLWTALGALTSTGLIWMFLPIGLLAYAHIFRTLGRIQ